MRGTKKFGRTEQQNVHRTGLIDELMIQFVLKLE